MPIAMRAALLVSVLVLVGCGKGGNAMTVTGTQGNTSIFLGLYRVPSESMDPTLKLGARVPVETGAPRLGEIVVFHPPEGAIAEVCGSATRIEPGGPPCAKSISAEASIKFIKRIVAGPGDTLKVIEGHVIRNGRREADSYIRRCPGVAECNFPVAIKVPAGEWYVLGDNRGFSDDSRFWGPVPTSWIIGVANLAAGPASDALGFPRKRMKGFEPSTFAMARRRSSQLSYIRAKRTF